MLKQSSFIKYEDAVDWVGIKREIAGAAGFFASLALQDLTYRAQTPGTEANATAVKYESLGGPGAITVLVDDQLITVTFPVGSTATQVRDAVRASIPASALVSVTTTGTGSNVQTAPATGTLAGGAYDAKYDPAIKRIMESLIDRSCAWVESYLRGPVLVRRLTDDYDGNSSNVVVPRFWPVDKLIELYVDYNREFTSPTKVDLSHYILRGGPGFQKSQSPEIRIEGTDIVMRNDGQNFIAGMIHPGSVLGCVRLVYDAGWARSIAEVPGPIAQATLMLFEFFWFQRQNRDLGVASKGVRGESYTKPVQDVPEQITTMLDPYVDTSFGSHPVPQLNSLGI